LEEIAARAFASADGEGSTPNALEDQLGHRPRAAAQIHDHLAARANHPFQDPAVDVQEE
jgi:hypothetical protein